jgi:hypothetical protein
MSLKSPFCDVQKQFSYHLTYMLTEDCTHKNISNIKHHNKKKVRKPEVATIYVSVISVLA